MGCDSKKKEFDRCFNQGLVLGSSTFGIIQLINNKKEILDEEIGKKFSLDKLDIKWVSPISPDYLEYYDDDFLKVLGLKEWTDSKIPLNQFWPKNGPHWDGLGFCINNNIEKVFIVEAKSRLPEMFNDIYENIQPKSLELIKKSLTDVFKHIRPYCDYQYIGDWTKAFYQYANRIAHLYYLRVLNELNGINSSADVYLVYVYFINDPYWHENAIKTKEEWEGIISTVKHYLGFSCGSHSLSNYVFDIFIDYNKIL